MAVKAYILIVTDPLQTREVYAALRQIPQISDVSEVMGPYDIVAEITVKDLSGIPAILSGQIRRLPGVESTTSLVTFPTPPQ